MWNVGGSSSAFFSSIVAMCLLLCGPAVPFILRPQKGLAGDNAGTAAKANEPNMWALEYNPAAPKGERVKTLQRSMIPRMYHSTAALTTDGSILIAGCDRCARYWCTTTPFSPSPTSYAEYRVEVFRAPDWFDLANKPEFEKIDTKHVDPKDPDVYVMEYGKKFYFSFSALNESATVTRAVLVSPSSTTHSTNMHQRIVGLEISAATDNTMWAVGPPNENIAPPGLYMMFLLNGDTFGSAQWVKLPGKNPLFPGRDYSIKEKK